MEAGRGIGIAFSERLGGVLFTRQPRVGLFGRVAASMRAERKTAGKLGTAGHGASPFEPDTRPHIKQTEAIRPFFECEFARQAQSRQISDPERFGEREEQNLWNCGKPAATAQIPPLFDRSRNCAGR